MILDIIFPLEHIKHNNNEMVASREVEPPGMNIHIHMDVLQEFHFNTSVAASKQSL